MVDIVSFTPENTLANFRYNVIMIQTADFMHGGVQFANSSHERPFRQTSGANLRTEKRF